MKAPGQERSRNDSPSAPRDPLVTELAKAESDLERIDAPKMRYGNPSASMVSRMTPIPRTRFGWMKSGGRQQLAVKLGVADAKTA